MSVIVAIKDKDRIVMGSDKQGTIGGSKDHTCTKIWEVIGLPGAIMGGVGSARVSQILQYSNIIDKNSFSENIDTAFIITSLTPIIQETLALNGIKCIVDEESISPIPLLPNSFIFAYKDKA
jgi:hypothetical protein